MKEVHFTIRCPKNYLNVRAHPLAVHKAHKVTRKAVWAALAESGNLQGPNARLVLAKAPQKRLVRFVRFWGGKSKEMDKEGFVAACKPILDALKLHDGGEGLIFDDSPAWVVTIYDQVKDAARGGLVETTISDAL